MKLKISLLIFAFAIIGFGSGFLATKFYTMKSGTQTASVINSINQENGTVVAPKETTLFFVGDIMLDRAVRTSVVKNFSGDYSKLFAKVGKLREADILFANLEGDVSDIGNNVGSKYSFRMDPSVLPAIKDAGFDIVSFANNHVGDWNMAAFKDTLTRLSDVGIQKAGAEFTKSEAEMPTIVERNGIKFGFIGFSDVGPDWIAATDTTPGILLASDPRLPEIIANAKKNCDVLIASFHWGVEYKKIHNIRQEVLAHIAIDNGADMVIGHHPHVMEDVEIYDGHPIVYSLGNFIFDQSFSKDTMEGMLFEATFLGKDLKDTKKQIITLSKTYQPEGIFESREEAERKRACPQPTKEYQDYSYLDVGQTVAIPDPTYIPSDLELLDKSITTRTPICLKKEAAEAVTKMIADAKKPVRTDHPGGDGYTIKVSSGFRTYATQKAILAREIQSGNKNASIAVAKPGYSEHQLGVTVDLTGSSILNASAAKKFEDSPEADWLEHHAYEYGFVESYPEDKEAVTGYMHEAWHYRYVGIDNAKKILEKNQTVNEFLKEQKEEAEENKTTQ